ncbi:MAG: sulfur carrier protein ThiS [bacterium]|nr:sulfur carrier protein ThiS [bacterium]
MNIRLNGADAETDAKTLAGLCDQLGYDSDAKIATAVNGEFMAKMQRANYQLANGDDIEIVAPRQGG